MNTKLENLQFLGVFGILQETLKLIYQRRKIFTQITLAFILPQYFFIFANMASSIFFLPNTKPSTIHYLIFKIISVLLSIILPLLSTATIIYTVACIYTTRDVSFKHAIRIVPKVWKKLLITFLTLLVALSVLLFAAALATIIVFMIVFSIKGPNSFRLDNYNLILMIAGITMFPFFVGSCYMEIIWSLSNPVSVLEDLCGLKAMAKSKALAKGKMIMITILFISLSLPPGVTQMMFSNLIVKTSSVGIVSKCIMGLVLVVLFSMFFMFMLVAQTVTYFVCKSYHHETIDNLDRLQSYELIDYVEPLKFDDRVQIEKLQVV